MLKRTIVISTPCKLSLSKCQLVVESEDNTSSVPIEDLGYVVIENQQTMITIPAMNALIGNNVAVIICDNKAMPAGLIHALDGNTIQGERYRIQINSSLPIKKNIWRQIVESKIQNQSKLLLKIGKDGDLLKPLYKNVKSGDSDNREGIAAAMYWKLLFGKTFIRDPKGCFPNNYLNYGYTILRAATARAIVGSGLLPSLGIHHKNRYNAFPLADDLMEPFRPWVDELVFSMLPDNKEILTREAKTQLTKIIYCDTKVGNRHHPMSIALSMLCTSVMDVMEGKKSTLSLPELV
ncbi:MAG: type II CRISPR-associated endonuclease Cas1 [Muribaculaceae bacterium]|nr:type II CRISPR-associated endonuclease Cas1 [Muribaculaceae bacterium]